MSFNPQIYVDGLSGDDDAFKEDCLATLSHAGITGHEQKIADLLIADPNQRVRKEAAKALEIFANANTTPQLLDALNDGYWCVRLHAFLALKKILGDSFNQTPLVQEAIARETNHYILHAIGM